LNKPTPILFFDAALADHPPPHLDRFGLIDLGDDFAWNSSIRS